MPGNFYFTINSTLCFKNKRFLSPFIHFWTIVFMLISFSQINLLKNFQFSISFHLMNLYFIMWVSYCVVTPLFILCQF